MLSLLHAKCRHRTQRSLCLTAHHLQAEVFFTVGMKEVWIYFSGALHTAVLVVVMRIREPAAAG